MISGHAPLASLPDPLSPCPSVEDVTAEVAGTVRENIQLRRAFQLSSSHGVVGWYMHGALAPGLGRIAAAVALQASVAAEGGVIGGVPPSAAAEGGVIGGVPPSALSENEAVRELAYRLAMQVVGAGARYLSRADVPREVVAAEEAVVREQAAKTGKASAIVERMVGGRMAKFYAEVCLLEQPFMFDDSRSVRSVVSEAGKAAGTPLEVAAFIRVQVGEGMEPSASKDFAAEVADTLKGMA